MTPMASRLEVRRVLVVAGVSLLLATAAACAGPVRVPRIGTQTGVRTWSSSGEKPAEEIRDPSGAPWGP
jgi:hypothetical protein